MVVLRADRVQRLGDAVEVDSLARKGERIGLHQPVLQVHLAQVEGVHRARHPGGVHVPEQHVEGRQRLAEQVAVHPVMPDQAVRAQQPKRQRHRLAVEVALARHQLVERAQAVLVDEDPDLARLGKVGQRGQQGPVRDWHLLGRVMPVGPGHVGRRQRAADAVADQMHLRHAAELAHDAHRFAQPLLQVVVEAEVLQLGTRVLPARDEDRKALLGQMLDQALVLVEVQDVELVDPGRADHDRQRTHLLGDRRVVDQLEQPVAPDHLARRGTEVAPDLERVGLDHQQLAGLEVAQPIGPACLQALAAGLERALDRARVGPEEVAWRDRVEPVVDPEMGLLLLVRAQAGCVIVQRAQPMVQAQEAFLQDVEAGRLEPGRVGEALVLGLGGDRIVRLHAEQPLHAMLVERQRFAPGFVGLLQQVLWVSPPGQLRAPGC